MFTVAIMQKGIKVAREMDRLTKEGKEITRELIEQEVLKVSKKHETEKLIGSTIEYINIEHGIKL